MTMQQYTGNQQLYSSASCVKPNNCHKERIHNNHSGTQLSYKTMSYALCSCRCIRRIKLIWQGQPGNGSRNAQFLGRRETTSRQAGKTPRLLPSPYIRLATHFGQINSRTIQTHFKNITNTFKYKKNSRLYKIVRSPT